MLFLFYYSIPAVVNSASIHSCKQLMGKTEEERPVVVLVSLPIDLLAFCFDYVRAPKGLT